jgi:hypothetical protein
LGIYEVTDFSRGSEEKELVEKKPHQLNQIQIASW